MRNVQRRVRSEDEWDEQPVVLPKGHADSDINGEEWMASDAALWIPDLSQQSGFSRYWVNRRGIQAARPRKVGFRP